MGQYTSYYLYQKFEKRDGQDFIPVYPNTYSVDADGTMPKAVKEQNDVNCGYVPPSDPIYQWVQLTPSSDPDSYWCDECPAEPIYRWTVMTPTSAPDSYWCDECPPEPIYRWVDSGTTCVGYDLYQREIKQFSYDSGATWENVVPTEYSATTLIEEKSIDCGFRPKLIANYSDSSSYRLACNSSTTLSQTEVRDYLTPYSSMTSVSIGNCVENIGVSAFTECTNLNNVSISSGVTSIGARAFYNCANISSVTFSNDSQLTNIGDYSFVNCSGITNIDIPSGVTSIGDAAFNSCVNLSEVRIPSGVTNIGGAAFIFCSGLSKVTIDATTPPTIGSNTFGGTNNCPIFVPCESVNTYKTASGWSEYASRIQTCSGYSTQYLTFEVLDSNFSKFKLSGSSSVQYSVDGGETWRTLSGGSYSPSVYAGDKIMWKGNLTPSNGIGIFYSIGSKFNVEGNVMSLLYGDDFADKTSLDEYWGAFQYLFSGNTYLNSAENLILPATTLSQQCYNSMFKGCTSLTTAPELPARNLAKTCYYMMFSNCTSLTTAPELPAATLAQSCYGYMFYGCTALTTAPILSASTLVNNCYDRMFYDCFSLNYVKCLATDISASECTKYWLNGVASSGTFVKYSSMSNWTTGSSGIPSNWTIQNVWG